MSALIRPERARLVTQQFAGPRYELNEMIEKRAQRGYGSLSVSQAQMDVPDDVFAALADFATSQGYEAFIEEGLLCVLWSDAAIRERKKVLRDRKFGLNEE